MDPLGSLRGTATGSSAAVTSFFGRAGRLFDTGTPADELLESERSSNKLLLAVQRDAALRDVLLRAAANADPEDDAVLHLLLPQNVTLDDVRVTKELLETHLVHVQHAAQRGVPRPFVALSGLCGTCLGDGSISVHGRLSRARTESNSALGGSSGGWDQRGRNGTVAQLESQIVVLRESQLPPSARLPLRAPLSFMLISDPLFFPGCGWKLPLALRQCTHRFAEMPLADLALSDLPQLLHEYQILARAFAEGAVADGGEGADAAAAQSAAMLPADDAAAAVAESSMDSDDPGAAAVTAKPATPRQQPAPRGSGAIKRADAAVERASAGAGAATAGAFGGLRSLLNAAADTALERSGLLEPNTATAAAAAAPSQAPPPPSSASTATPAVTAANPAASKAAAATAAAAAAVASARELLSSGSGSCSAAAAAPRSAVEVIDGASDPLRATRGKSGDDEAGLATSAAIPAALIDFS